MDAGHNLARDSPGPIRLCQITMDDIQINSFLVGADNELALVLLCDLFLAGFHAADIL